MYPFYNLCHTELAGVYGSTSQLASPDEHFEQYEYIVESIFLTSCQIFTLGLVDRRSRLMVDYPSWHGNV